MFDWDRGQLADSIAALDAGVSVNADDRPHGAGEIGVLKTSAVSGGRFYPEQNKTVVEHERRLVAEPVQADSILVSRMNTPALVGDSCYVPDSQPNLFLPDRLWQLKPKDRSSINMRWLSFVLQSAAYRRYVEVHATGTSGSMKNLPQSKLLALPVNYPAPREQAKIAQVLDTLDTVIQETEAIIAKLRAVKQGLLHDLLTRGIDASGELRPPQPEAPHLYKPSPLGWVPEEWECCQAASVLISIDAGKSPDCQDIPAASDQWGVLKVGAVHPDGLRLEENKVVEVEGLKNPAYLIRRGDLLLSRANTFELVGLVCHVTSDPKNLMLSDKTLRLTVRDSRMTTRFLFWQLQHPRSRTQIENAATGTSGSMKNISQSSVEKMWIVRPSLDEQKEISRRLDAIACRYEVEMNGCSKLRKLKSGLMDDLLTGHVRVTPLLAEGEQQEGGI